MKVAMGLVTTTEMEDKLSITCRRIVPLCKEGRIEGAVLIGGN